MKQADRRAIIAKVRDVCVLSKEDNPYKERDFGVFNYGGAEFYWKIYYHSPDLQQASEDPADPDKTYRLLTIMRGDEYFKPPINQNQ